MSENALPVAKALTRGRTGWRQRASWVSWLFLPPRRYLVVLARRAAPGIELDAFCIYDDFGCHSVVLP